MNKNLICILAALFLLTGCSLKELKPVQEITDTVNSTKEDLSNAKNNIDKKVDQAKTLQKEFNEFTNAWDEFSGNTENSEN